MRVARSLFAPRKWAYSSKYAIDGCRQDGIRAVRALEGWLSARPSLRPILQAIADSETHEGVRAEARNAVLTRKAPTAGG